MTMTPYAGNFLAMNRKYTDEQILKMKELRETGVPCSKIGEMFSCCHQTVYRLTMTPEKLKRWRERSDARKLANRDNNKANRRQHQLTVDGKVLRNINKRPRPDYCEICHKYRNRLEWHHWDDKEPELGLWLCIRCHAGVEFIEQGKDKVYLTLKEDYAEITVI